jgi:hypothetical protein
MAQEKTSWAIQPSRRNFMTKKYLAAILAALVVGVGAIVPPASALVINGSETTWSFRNDQWFGTLKLNPVDQIHNMFDGQCSYTYSVVDGAYTLNGQSVAVTGTIGGKDDQQQSGAACPQSRHLVQLNIGGQQFRGYFMGPNNDAIAGTTWWNGIPFAWYANKQ